MLIFSDKVREILGQKINLNKGDSKMYTDYMIVSANSLPELANQVKQFMGLGWQPLGGAINAGNNPNQTFAQTLVKTE